jgi:BirA family biotin operon repressor/biotin-[acetyl-CoA-carboxylase] ligase
MTGEKMKPLSSDDPLDTNSLGRGPLRRAVHGYRELESTNDAARALAEAGEPEGALVIADFQRSGRGRMNRAWQAPDGSSLLFSMLLRPPIGPAQALLPVMAVSLGVMEGIRRVGDLPARLKWPNDILIREKKAGGILCELGLECRELKYVIVGVGVNVNFDPRAVAGIPPDATSIQVELGRRQPRAELLRAILEEIEPRYRKIARGESLREEWARALATIGRRVKVSLPKEEFSGMAEAIDESGALLLRQDDGTLRTILAGDVMHVKSDDRP